MGVLIEVSEGYGVVTLDWPDQKNALGPDEANELSQAITETSGRAEVNSVVLSGAGGAFCAGGNIRGMVERAHMPPEERRRLVYGAYQGVVRAIVGSPVPFIAAIDGPAIGMGFDIALACDLRLFGPSGWARQGWGRIGAIPGTGGELFLRHVSPGALWRILPGQTRVDGVQAASLGIGENVPEGTALGAAEVVARSLAEMPPATVRGYIELSRARVRAELEEHLAECLRIQIGLLADPGFTARASSALAKKPAAQ